MKKELVSFLQFILIAGAAGFGHFGLMLLRKTTILSLYREFEYFFLNWIFSFIILGLIRLAVGYFYFLKMPYDSAPLSGKDLIEKEASTTMQYLILAVIAIPISFNLSLPGSSPNISFNIFEIWRNVNGLYFAWLIVFFILSLLRIAIVYLQKRFEGQINL
jgi:hypothetical protein